MFCKEVQKQQFLSKIEIYWQSSFQAFAKDHSKSNNIYPRSLTIMVSVKHLLKEDRAYFVTESDIVWYSALNVVYFSIYIRHCREIQIQTKERRFDALASYLSSFKLKRWVVTSQFLIQKISYANCLLKDHLCDLINEIFNEKISILN